MKGRLVALAALLALVPTAPFGGAAGEGVHIPFSQGGDFAHYTTEQWRSDGSNAFTGGYGRTWGDGLHVVEDAFGIARSAFDVTLVFDIGGVNTYAHEIGTGTVLRWNGAVHHAEGSRDDLAFLPPDVPLAWTTTSARDEQRYLYQLYPAVTLAAQGRTFLPGESLTATAPNIYRGGTTTVGLVAVGWETTPQGVLFRFDVLGDDPRSTQRVYYDGVRPVPVRAESAYQLSTSVSHSVNVLDAFVPGDGPALADPAYAPPPFVSALEAFPYAADGPSEDFGTSLALADATAALRAHPVGVAFFALHPDAYLVEADFRDSGSTIWDLVYADGTEMLIADVRGAGDGAVVLDARLASGEPWPPASQVVGQEVACVAESRKMLALTPAAEGAPFGDFHISRADGTFGCRYGVEAREPSGDPAGTETLRVTRSLADVHGSDGIRDRFEWTSFTSERKVTVG